MKKLALLIFMIFTIFPSGVFAVDVINPACDTADVARPAICDEDTSGQGTTSSSNVLVGPDGVLTNLTQVLVYFIGAMSVLMIVIGAFKFVISQGNSDAVSSARNTILFAAIGLVIAISAQAIVTFILGRI